MELLDVAWSRTEALSGREGGGGWGGLEGLRFECRVKKIPRIKQLCNSAVPRDKKSWKIPLLIIIAL